MVPESVVTTWLVVKHTIIIQRHTQSSCIVICLFIAVNHAAKENCTSLINVVQIINHSVRYYSSVLCKSGIQGSAWKTPHPCSCPSSGSHSSAQFKEERVFVHKQYCLRDTVCPCIECRSHSGLHKEQYESTVINTATSLWSPHVEFWSKIPAWSRI